MSRPAKPRWSDVQGLVVGGYKHLPVSAVIVFSMQDADAAKAIRHQLAALIMSERITDARKEDGLSIKWPSMALNVAFTASGLRHLTGGGYELDAFPRAFVTGMTGDDRRTRILGDLGTSAPCHWSWGAPGQPRVDGALFLFASDEDRLGRLRQDLAPLLAAVTVVRQLATKLSAAGNGPDVREPFGFVDGLSQPLLEGTKAAQRQPDSRHVIKLGEMLLGYEDNAGCVSPAPPLHGIPDFGLNGTYLVLRQLRQDVDGFRRFLEAAALAQHMTVDELAAKLMGRTFNGELITPNGCLRPAADNEFDFVGDPDGFGCPRGAHIRRATPRDTLGKDAEAGWRITNRHRILRRGRPYEAGGETGLAFVALNADLERQFEFIQGTWMNDEGFGELAGERDPIVGWPADNGTTGVFRIPQRPLRRRVTGVRSFVATRGGAYFFMPGLRGLGQLVGARL